MADRLIEIDAMQELLAKKVVPVERKREAVVFLKTKEVSERRSCQLILLARSTCQYTIKRVPDQEFERVVKELAFANPRYGYRRVHALLRRRGQTVNRKRVVRVWQKFGLQVPCSKQKRKRQREPQPIMPVATRPNEVWTYDFVFDRGCGWQDASADIHICFQKDGKWGEPVNLGASVNSTFLENAPSLAPDGKTLYFTSMRSKVVTFPKVKENKNAVLKRLRTAENGSRNIWQVDISALLNR